MTSVSTISRSERFPDALRTDGGCICCMSNHLSSIRRIAYSLQNTRAFLLLKEATKESVLVLVDKVCVGVTGGERRSQGLRCQGLLKRHALGVISGRRRRCTLGVHAVSHNGHGLVTREEVGVTRVNVACLSTVVQS